MIMIDSKLVEGILRGSFYMSEGLNNVSHGHQEPKWDAWLLAIGILIQECTNELDKLTLIINNIKYNYKHIPIDGKDYSYLVNKHTNKYISLVELREEYSFWVFCIRLGRYVYNE